MRPRSILRILPFAAMVIFSLGAARAADDATGFVRDLGKRAIDVLTSQTAEAQREVKFRALFEEGFDVPGIARFVLGPNWRKATDAQREEFTKLFEAYVVHAYTVRFNQYNNQQFNVLGNHRENDSLSLVSSQITQPNNAPPVKVDWRVAKTDRGFKITDVIVEGISMAITEREEFASVIQRGGGQIEALLKLLREKTGQG